MGLKSIHLHQTVNFDPIDDWNHYVLSVLCVPGCAGSDCPGMKSESICVDLAERGLLITIHAYLSDLDLLCAVQCLCCEVQEYLKVLIFIYCSSSFRFMSPSEVIFLSRS